MSVGAVGLLGLSVHAAVIPTQAIRQQGGSGQKSLMNTAISIRLVARQLGIFNQLKSLSCACIRCSTCDFNIFCVFWPYSCRPTIALSPVATAYGHTLTYPTVLTIVHYNGTYILSLYSRFNKFVIPFQAGDRIDITLFGISDSRRFNSFNRPFPAGNRIDITLFGIIDSRRFNSFNRPFPAGDRIDITLVL
jgi:hypothetical protein